MTKITNFTVANLTTEDEPFSFPFDSVDTDLTDKHEKKSFFNPIESHMTIECDYVNNAILSDLAKIAERPDAWDIRYNVLVQARKHKKKRINKKWAKRYGYKFIARTSEGWKVKAYDDGSFKLFF